MNETHALPDALRSGFRQMKWVQRLLEYNMSEQRILGPWNVLGWEEKVEAEQSPFVYEKKRTWISSEGAAYTMSIINHNHHALRVS